jgi:GTP-binding protein
MPQFPAASFISSAWQPRQFPADEGAEVAFAGRSNAGKSSALNALCGRRQLARVSRTPGRTQLLNFFELADGRIVDLPGYGFAKVPKDLRAGWGGLIEGYLLGRECLRGVVVVMDARHPLTDFDRAMLEWSRARDLPCHALLTKADKLTSGAARKTLREVENALPALHPHCSAQLFSAHDHTGVEEARGLLGRWLE